MGYVSTYRLVGALERLAAAIERQNYLLESREPLSGFTVKAGSPLKRAEEENLRSFLCRMELKGSAPKGHRLGSLVRSLSYGLEEWSKERLKDEYGMEKIETVADLAKIYRESPRPEPHILGGLSNVGPKILRQMRALLVQEGLLEE